MDVFQLTCGRKSFLECLSGQFRSARGHVNEARVVEDVHLQPAIAGIACDVNRFVTKRQRRVWIIVPHVDGGERRQRPRQVDRFVGLAQNRQGFGCTLDSQRVVALD